MGPTGADDRRILTPSGLDRLIQRLREVGYETYGPTVHDSVVGLAPVEGIGELPRGVGDETAPGRYRLSARTDGAYFGFAAPADSWKMHLFPPTQVLFTAVSTEDGIRFEPAEPPPTKRAFLGVRGCDLAAMAILDDVLLHHDYPDPRYAAQRARVFVAAVDCATPAATCFCSSMGTGPAVGPGADLVLTELDPGTPQHRFLVAVGSDEGAAVLAAVPTAAAGPADLETAASVRAHAEAAVVRQMPAGGGQPDPEDPRWSVVARRCLSCANCTMACPTCFCTDIADEDDPVTGATTRTRAWGSCFELGHSYLHGGAVRASPMSRYRQWLTHKLFTWPEQFGTSGCVGCGRCIAWCPAGIDITEEAAALRR